MDRSRLLGVLFVVGSALFFSCHSCVVRIVSDDGFSTTAVTLWVGVTRLIIATFMVPFKKEWRNNLFCTGYGYSFVGLVVLRQIVGVMALACMYASYSMMPLGEATAMVFTAPIWTTILAFIFLHEPLTRVNMSAAICACLGVALIAFSDTPEAEETHEAGEGGRRAVGTVFALTGSVLLAGMMVTTRAIGNRQPAVVSSGWYGLSLILLSLPMMAVVGADVAPAGVADKSWVLMFSGAAVSFFAQTLVIMSLQRLEAGPVNVLATLEIVFSFTWQVTLLGTKSHLTSVLGVTIIVACAVLVSAQKMIFEKLRGGKLSPSDGDDLDGDDGVKKDVESTHGESSASEQPSKQQMGASLLGEDTLRSDARGGA